MRVESERNVNINIRDNRGIATLAGLIIVLILTRLWWTGLLSEMLAGFYSPTGEAMNSPFSYMIMAFIANIIYGIGTIFIMIWSGLWWVIADIVQGFRQWAAERAAREQLVNDLAADEVDEATGQNPMIEILQTIESNMQVIADKIDEIDARVSMAEAELEKKPATRTTTKKA